MQLLRVTSLGLTVSLAVSATAQEVRMQGDPTGRDAVVRKSELTPEQKKKYKELSQSLLSRAASSAKDLSSNDRAFLLARLADASVKSSPDQASAWAEEAFQAADSMPPNMQRNQTIMQAITAVSKINVDRALQMIMEIDPPRPSANGQMPPDTRAMVALMVFQQQWKKNGVAGLDAIQSTARQLGETGHYPYMALTPVIRQAANKDRERAAALAQDALSFLSSRRVTEMENHHIANFIGSAAEFLPASVIKETIEKLVKESKEIKDEGLQMRAQIADDKGNRADLSSTSMMLMQLMPVIRRIDPEWAQKLEKDNAELQQLAVRQSESGMRQVNVVARIGADAEDGPARDVREEMTSMQVDGLAARDPQRALTLSNDLKDPALRAASHAKIAGELSRTDPEQAAKLLKEARAALAEATTPQDRLMIIAGLAQAQAAMKDTEGFNDTVNRGLAMAEEMFRKGVDRRPTAPVFTQPGYELMGRLVAVAAKADPQLAVAKIEGIRSPVLQSMMLVNAARAIDPDGTQDGPGLRIEIED
jgi:hypothetical protein